MKINEEIDGVFTIGEESKDLKNRLDKLKAEKDERRNHSSVLLIIGNLLLEAHLLIALQKMSLL